MGTPAEPGNERPMGADGSAGEFVMPGSGRAGDAVARVSAEQRRTRTIIAYVTYIRNVSVHMC